MPSRKFKAEARQAGIAIDGLRALFNGLDEGVVLLTPDSLIVWANPAAETLFGYTKEDLSGQPFAFLRPEQGAGGRQAGGRSTLFHAPQDRRSNEWFRCSDGSVFISRTTQSAVTSDSGQTIGHMIIIRDISRQHALENALADLYAVSCNPDLPSDKKVGGILDIGRAYFDMPIGTVNLIENGSATVVHSVSSAARLPRGRARDLSKTFCSHAMCFDEPTAFHEAGATGPTSRSLCKYSGIEAYIGIPLIVDGDRFGTLCFMGPDRRVPFTAADLELIKLFAAWVSQEMSRRQSMKLLEDAARHDPLTGILNRGAFDAEVASHFGHGLTKMVESSLLVIDLDHFKAINDTYGHAAGDEVLISVAARMSALLGPEDVLGRIGGEEFAVLIHGFDGDAALRKADAFRAAIADQPIRITDIALNVTASIGIARLTSAVAAAGDWMKAADAAVYNAKQGGRNQCHDADVPATPPQTAAMR